MSKAQRPWLVRVMHNKVGVGVFFCPTDALAEFVDEICDPADCEAAQLNYGGFIYEADPVLDGSLWEVEPEELDDLTFRASQTIGSHVMGDQDGLKWHPVMQVAGYPRERA